MDYFRKQDDFEKEMLSFYKEGILDDIYAPYFDWKCGGCLPSKNDAFKMMEAASASLNELFDNSSGSKLQIFLEAIDCELTNILPMLK